MSSDPRLLVISPAPHGHRRAASGPVASYSPHGRGGALAAADGLCTAGRARTLAEHTFVHPARDLEALWRA